MQGFRKKTAILGMMALLMGLGTASAATRAIQVQDAYVKAVPPTMENTVAYMKLKNPNDKAVRLEKASSPVARVVEIHKHLHEKGGMMKMVKLDSIEIPAHGQVELKPMGLHLMLIGLKPDFQKRKAVFLKLFFSNHSHVIVRAPVRKPDGSNK